MSFDWETLIERSLGPAKGNQAYFSYMVKDVKDYLGNDASREEIILCTTKLLTALIYNEWITVFDIFQDNLVSLNMPPEDILRFVLDKWEKIGWRDPKPWEVMWYELSSKGTKQWCAL